MLIDNIGQIIKPQEGFISLGGIRIYQSINDGLLDEKIIKFIKEKCKQYHKKVKYRHIDHHEFVGLLCNYDLKIFDSTENELTAGCIEYNSHIELSSEVAYNSDMDFDVWRVLSHEISHAFQAELEIEEKLPSLISARIMYEQQCETMAYYLYNNLFPHRNINKKLFNSYFDEEHHLILSEYYEGFCENDIFDNKNNYLLF